MTKKFNFFSARTANGGDDGHEKSALEANGGMPGRALRYRAAGGGVPGISKPYTAADFPSASRGAEGRAAADHGMERGGASRRDGLAAGAGRGV